jgi:probable rRNA maturation factor
MRIVVSNRQRAVRVDRADLQAFATAALAACLKLPARQYSLGRLEQVEVVLVSDKRIAEIHQRFLDDATPTDVITFQHGEIVISAETAKRQARHFRTSVQHELRLYLAHGLLHLHGYEDKTARGAATMKRLQEKLVDRALSRSMAATEAS